MAQLSEEQDGRLTELDRLKSEFVSSIAHELRTPLTTIKTYARMMLRSGVSKTERREYLQIIMDECDRQIAFENEGASQCRKPGWNGKIFTVCLPVWRDDNGMANISEVG